MDIKLPQLSWFRQIQDNRPVRNFLTGSLGTDPAKGALHKTIFNYQVNAEEETTESGEEKITLLAQCHIQLPYTQRFERRDHRKKVFEFSAQGIADATEWLKAQYKDLMPDAPENTDSTENN